MKYMAKMKITDVSKDFSLKSKDVIDAFRAVGIEKNSGGSVNEEEFEAFMQHMTLTHQIKDLDAYCDGKTKISVPHTVKAEAVKPAPVREEPAKVQEKKPEQRPEQRSAAPKSAEPAPETTEPTEEAQPEAPAEEV